PRFGSRFALGLLECSFLRINHEPSKQREQDSDRRPEASLWTKFVANGRTPPRRGMRTPSARSRARWRASRRIDLSSSYLLSISSKQTPLRIPALAGRAAVLPPPYAFRKGTRAGRGLKRNSRPASKRPATAGRQPGRY